MSIINTLQLIVRPQFCYKYKQKTIEIKIMRFFISFLSDMLQKQSGHNLLYIGKKTNAIQGNNCSTNSLKWPGMLGLIEFRQ